VPVIDIWALTSGIASETRINDRHYHELRTLISMPAFHLGQREARQNLTPQLLRIGRAVRSKNHQPLTELRLQFTIVREARKEVARLENVPSPFECEVDCRESFRVTMTGN
jgi:hypothetical protein